VVRPQKFLHSQATAIIPTIILEMSAILLEISAILLDIPAIILKTKTILGKKN